MTQSKTQADAKLEAIEAAKNWIIGDYVTIGADYKLKDWQLSGQNIDPSISFDVAIYVTPTNYQSNDKHIGWGTFLFDVVDVPLPMRLPEFMELAANKVLVRSPLGTYSVREKYLSKEMIQRSPEGNCRMMERYLLSDMFIRPKSGGTPVRLREEYVKLLIKYATIKYLSGKTYGPGGGLKYHLLGTDDIESCHTRIGHALYTGRCDRVIGACKYDADSIEQSIMNILKESGCKKKLRTGKIHLGKGEWQRVIFD